MSARISLAVWSLLWNRGAETLFGYDAGESVGHTLDLIVPEAYRTASHAGQVMGIVAIGRDVTERRAREQADRERIRG